MKFLLVGFVVLTLTSRVLSAQDANPYSTPQSVAVGVEYSNTSSHILLGVAENRRIAGVDITYSRRLIQTRFGDLHYDFLLRPLTFIQDPVSTVVVIPNGAAPPGSTPESTSGPILRSCVSGASSGFGYSETQTCGTRWTYAGGINPLGLRINLLSHRRIQPLLLGNAGFLVATRDIPSGDSARFNFVFDFGAGVVINQSAGHAFRVEYRIQHISNANRGVSNPGIDSQLLRVAYVYGLRRNK